MPDHINVLINQIIIFSILLIVGFAAAKAKVFTKDSLNALSRIIVKIILPAFIFDVVARGKVTSKEFLVSGRFALGVIICFSILILAGFITQKLCNLNEKLLL